MDNVKKIKRTAKLVTILSKYGFETLVTQTGLKQLVPNSYIEHNEKRKEIFSLTVYERIRMALEEMGPAYVKLGQLLSNRDDILPTELTNELSKLQDNVQLEHIDLYATLREELSIDPDEVFDDIDIEPIAAASLSQVYTATLKGSDKKVVIKVKRKGIRDMIEADILIMKDFASLLEKYYDAARKISLTTVVNAFERSIISELSFKQELNNMERFRKNFKDDDTIYVPTSYKEYSTINILCMEFIDGIKISHRDQIIEVGLDPKDVASKVVGSYMKQVVDYGFFHADPHSGNIFVLATGQIVFIDYGSMGKMLPQDQEALGVFVLYAIKKDTRSIVRIIKNNAIKYNIPNEGNLERELYEFLDIIDGESIKELDLKDLVKRFSGLLNQNQIILPEYIYLLVRGIMLLEGIGRELGLETSVIEYIKPYSQNRFQKELNPKAITNRVFDKLLDIGDKLDRIPDDIQVVIQKIKNDELIINQRITGISQIKNALNRLTLALLSAMFALSSSILIFANMPPLAWGVSVIGFLGLLLSGCIAILVVLSIIRDKKD